MPKITERKRQFPKHYVANPGHSDVTYRTEKEKLIGSPSKGPMKKKSKAKGRPH